MLMDYPAHKPVAVALPSGTVQPLSDSGNLASDVHRALVRMGANPPLSVTEIERILRFDKITAGLHAEAGMRASRSSLLHFKEEVLTSGVKIERWLTLSPTVAGDAVYWMVVTGRSRDAISCGCIGLLGQLLSQLRIAGGGVTSEKEYWFAVPTDEELAEIAKC